MGAAGDEQADEASLLDLVEPDGVGGAFGMAVLGVDVGPSVIGGGGRLTRGNLELVAGGLTLLPVEPHGLNVAKLSQIHVNPMGGVLGVVRICACPTASFGRGVAVEGLVCSELRAGLDAVCLGTLALGDVGRGVLRRRKLVVEDLELVDGDGIPLHAAVGVRRGEGVYVETHVAGSDSVREVDHVRCRRGSVGGDVGVLPSIACDTRSSLSGCVLNPVGRGLAVLPEDLHGRNALLGTEVHVDPVRAAA